MRETDAFLLAKGLIPNCELAQVMEGGSLPEFSFIAPRRPRRERVGAKLRICKGCGVEFLALPRARYHSPECKNRNTVKLYRIRRKQQAARYEEMAKAKNAEWLDYHTKTQFGFEATPPIHRGRPTKVKASVLQSFRNKMIRNKYKEKCNG